MELFFSGSAASADDLLAKLGTMDRLVAANRGVYAPTRSAPQQRQSLSDKAKLARDERDRLQKEAQQKMQAAQDAAAAAQAALAEQDKNLGTLQAQLAALQDQTAKTVADYQAGVEAARKAEEARRPQPPRPPVRPPKRPRRQCRKTAAVAVAAEEAAVAERPAPMVGCARHPATSARGSETAARSAATV